MKKPGNLIKMFVLCLKRAEPISRIILRAGLICSILACIGAVAVFTPLFPYRDAATAEYWSQQLFTLSVYLLGATAIPTFLFETILYALGAKNENGAGDES